MFADGELGRLSGGVSGEGFEIAEGSLRATIRATMTATERDRRHVVVRPTN